MKSKHTNRSRFSKSTLFTSKHTDIRAVSVRKSVKTEHFPFHPSLNEVSRSITSRRKKNSKNIHKKLFKEDKRRKDERDRVYTQK